MSTSKKSRFTKLRAAVAMVAVGAMTATTGALVLSVGDTAAAKPEVKVFVCKYVGKPGVDERLQTGNNPISVSANTIPGWPGTTWFADAHGSSFVLGVDETAPGSAGDPARSDCPSVDRPDPKVVTTTESRMSCEVGVEQRSLTVTTEYVFDARHHTWVLGEPGDPVVGTWTFVRDLTRSERNSLECETEPTSVRAVPYDATPPTCDLSGVLVVKDQPEGVKVHQSPKGTGPGTYSITFHAEEGFVLTGPSTQTITVLPKLTGGQCEAEPTLLTPLYPTVNPATCQVAGSLVTPTQPEGVLVDRTGTTPGDVTFRFSPDEGFAFPTGTTTTVTLTVAPQLTGAVCGEVQGVEGVTPEPTVKGTEETKPEPTVKGTGSTKPEPAVKGTEEVRSTPSIKGVEASAPTAVNAGIGDPQPAGSPRYGLVARLLVGSGLVLMAAAGWLVLGRRADGEHKI